MKCRGNQLPMRTFLIRALSFSAAAAMTLCPALIPAVASDRPVTPVADGQMNAHFLSLGVGKSIVIDLPRDIKDVLVADPKIANAVVRSAQRAYIIGAAIGQTNIVFFDSAGQQIAAYDIAVKRDLNGARAALKQILPNSDIQIEGLGDSVVLSGTAASPIDAQQAGDLAARLAGGAEKVVNSIAVRGRDQVMLRVTVAEVARSIVKQLGIDLSGKLNYGTAVVNFNNVNPFTVTGQPLVANNAITPSFGTSPTVQATDTGDGGAPAWCERWLSEPDGNLRKFGDIIAGGEVPDPDRRDLPNDGGRGGRQCAPSIAFKKFGISLNFTPIVLTEGRISLRVMTEVSENLQRQLDHGHGHYSSLGQDPPRGDDAGNPFGWVDGDGRPDPGADQTGDQRAARSLQVPVLGSLFRSRDYINNQTELMVLVTPYVVRAVAQKDLSRPDDGFASASDPQSDLLGSINRIYGVPGRVEPARNYRGAYGFITD